MLCTSVIGPAHLTQQHQHSRNLFPWNRPIQVPWTTDVPDNMSGANIPISSCTNRRSRTVSPLIPSPSAPFDCSIGSCRIQLPTPGGPADFSQHLFIYKQLHVTIYPFFPPPSSTVKKKKIVIICNFLGSIGYSISSTRQSRWLAPSSSSDSQGASLS